MSDPTKAKIVVRSTLLALEWYRGLAALDLVFEHHTGLRKDKKTPSWAHQLFIIQYVLTLRNELIRGGGEEFAENCVILAGLHDIHEDTDYSLKLIEEEFGHEIEQQVWTISKKGGDSPIKPRENYYAELAKKPGTAIVKGIDRFHNITTMADADWTPEKQLAYMQEAEEFVLPMLKTARRSFPQYELVFQNLKLVLENQIKVIRLGLEASRPPIIPLPPGRPDEQGTT